MGERPKWVPPAPPAEAIPTPVCPWCGKPIKDMAAAIADRGTGEPVHFDCVAARLAESEPLEKGESVAYLGGGRFGVVRFNSAPNAKRFVVRKVVEWEKRDERAAWRSLVSDHYSST